MLFSLLFGIVLVFSINRASFWMLNLSDCSLKVWLIFQVSYDDLSCDLILVLLMVY